MPIIYTSIPALGRTVSTPEYEKRGLEKQIAVRLGELMAVGLPYVRQLAYSGYIFNINAFMYATAVQKRVICSANFFLPPVPVSRLFSVPFPSLFIAPRKALKTDEDKTRFAERMGNAELSKFGQRDVYIMHSPTIEMIMALPFKELDTNCPSPPNGTSISGFRTLLTTLKIITLFLSTHTYPAFSTEDQNTSTHEYDVNILAELMTASTNEFRYSESLRDRYAGLGVGDMDLEDDTVLVDGQVIPNAPEIDTKAKGLVTVAKPAPFRPEINIGSPSELPAMPGYLFEYFSGCYVPDTAFVSTMMLECFVNSLGDTKETAAAAYESWHTGYEKWYKTEAGKIIGHIFLGMRLAMQGQARLFILKPSGRYAGFSLLGAKFAIGINGKIVPHSTPEVLRRQAIDLDIHTAALEKCCQLLSKTCLKGKTVMVEVRPENIGCTRHLWKEVVRRDEFEGEEWTVFSELWGKIGFEERFWPLTHINIARAIHLIFDDKKEIPDDLACFLPDTLLYDTTRVARVLSAFGPMAPSFIDQKGVEIAVPIGDGVDPAAVIDPSTGKRAMEVILVSGKRLEAAIDDFNNLVKKRRIRQNFAERAAGFRTLKFNGDARDMIWAAIKTMPVPKVPESKKRGREEETEEEREARMAKKAKAVEKEVDFTMDF